MSMTISDVINFLGSYGIHINISDANSPLVLFALMCLLCSFVSLLCVFNIVLYLFVIYCSETKIILDFVSNYSLLKKIFNFYKTTRKLYIIIEFEFLLFNISIISYYSLLIINLST